MKTATRMTRQTLIRSYDFVENRKDSTVFANVLLGDDKFKYVPDPLGIKSMTQKIDRTTGVAESFTCRADQTLTSYLKDGIRADYFYDALSRHVTKKITKGSDPSFTQSYVHLGVKDKILLGGSGDGEITLYLDGKELMSTWVKCLRAERKHTLSIQMV